MSPKGGVIGYGRANATHQAPTLHPGDHVELVRWTITPDGYKPVLIVGRYISRDRENYRIKCGDRLEVLPRADWEVCIA